MWLTLHSIRLDGSTAQRSILVLGGQEVDVMDRKWFSGRKLINSILILIRIIFIIIVLIIIIIIIIKHDLLVDNVAQY